MCSKEEVEKIVNESEKRMELKLEALEQKWQNELERSHVAVAGTVSALGAEFKDIAKDFKAFVQKWDHIEADDLRIVISSYNGIATVKNIITGMATVILSISAIGAGVIWLVKTIVSK